MQKAGIDLFAPAVRDRSSRMKHNELRVLTSWKEIARYLNKAVRTVQRWERERGLPVRRMGENDRKSSIIAMPEELDEWVHVRFPEPGGKNIKDELVRLRNELAECHRKHELCRSQLHRLSVTPQEQSSHSR